MDRSALRALRRGSVQMSLTRVPDIALTSLYRDAAEQGYQLEHEILDGKIRQALDGPPYATEQFVKDLPSPQQPDLGALLTKIFYDWWAAYHAPRDDPARVRGTLRALYLAGYRTLPYLLRDLLMARLVTPDEVEADPVLINIVSPKHAEWLHSSQTAAETLYKSWSTATTMLGGLTHEVLAELADTRESDYPLDNERFYPLAVELFQRTFGGSADLWAAGLSLAPPWKGSVNELVETVRGL